MPGAVLITGANGYLGRRVVEKLAARGRDVVAIWHRRLDAEVQGGAGRVAYCRCDLADRAAVERIVEDRPLDAVVHAAALLPDGAPGYLSRAVVANVAATAHLAELAAEAGCERFVYCSSISVYGSTSCPVEGWTEDLPLRPANAYGWSKQAGEECVRLVAEARAMSAVSLRLAGIHGTGRSDGVAFNVTRAALRGNAVTLPASRVPFQLVFIDEAIEAVARALERPLPAGHVAVNVASHLFASLNDLAGSIIEVCRSTSDLVESAPGASGAHVMNTHLMSELLGVAPVDARVRLLDLAQWVKTRNAPERER